MNIERFIKKNGVQNVSLVFPDIHGELHYFSVPAKEFIAGRTSGFAYDGSSIQGQQEIHESDMAIKPGERYFVDPFAKQLTCRVFADLYDPVTKKRYENDPRHIAEKAQAFLRSTGVADTAYFGPELEFFLFNSVQFEDGKVYIFSEEAPDYSFFQTKSHPEHGIIVVNESSRNDGSAKRQDGHHQLPKRAYFPLHKDKTEDVRNEIVRHLEEAGIEVEAYHHEVAPNQNEINMRRGQLLAMADNAGIYKYMAKRTASRNRMTATFIPKILPEDNGSGMHVHQSLWMGGRNMFAGKEYGGLSKLALQYAAGILAHADALCAFTNPITISYKRLVPGFEAPTRKAFSARNRSAGIRVPTSVTDGDSTRRIEVRFPDPSANPYLSFAAMLMAGLDGIERELEPPAPIETNAYTTEGVGNIPGSLNDALEALERDHEFLVQGDVFTSGFIDKFFRVKQEELREMEELKSNGGSMDNPGVPHVKEIYRYFSC